MVKRKGRRFDNSLKSFAISLYPISGKAYRFLAKLLNLPSKKTLTSLVSKFASGVGFSDKSLYVLRQRVQRLSPEAKVCTLLMDEVSLKSNLFYDCKSDSIIGLEDLGNGKTSGAIANSAFVLMVRGILQKWKQPVAFYLVNESCNSVNLKAILAEAIGHLEAMDLNVVSIVSDQGSNFLSFLNAMDVSEDKPYIEINNKRYLTILDPPHLIKSVRNNLMKYTFEFGDKVAQWGQIKLFFEKDQKLPIRMAPKLTERHLNPNGFTKMRVKLATQVISHTVAAALNTYVSLQALPGAALGTAQLLSKFDKIFDCCNALSFKDTKICRRPITAQSPHINELTSGLAFIKSIKVLNKGTGEDRTPFIKCLKGWCITTKAILYLWEKLQHQGIASFLVTRQLNQDPLENFFGAVRQQGGNSDNPTPVQFIRAYRKLFHTNLLLVASGNCEMDDNELIANLQSLHEENTIMKLSTEKHRKLTIISSDYASEDIQKRLIQENGIAYLTGYLLRKTYITSTNVINVLYFLKMMQIAVNYHFLSSKLMNQIQVCMEGWLYHQLP